MYRNTQKMIDKVCEYRNLPKIKKGDKCMVDGQRGVIVGGNSSSNLNVKFDETGLVLNCHPNWKMKIFNNSGEVLYDSKRNS